MSKKNVFCLTLFLLMVIVTLIGPWLAPWATDDIRDMPFAPPADTLLMGSDYLGADVLSRVLSGGQQLLIFAVLSVALAWLTGGMAGMVAAIEGRWLDRALLTVADVLLSIPGLLLLTLVVTVSGRGYSAAALAALLVMFPDIFRLVRAATLNQLQQDYVEMARLRGESLRAILFREIAPNLLPLLSADLGIRLLTALFILASASFLGLGAMPPQADWGLMITENRQGLTLQPWATLAPITAILLLLIPLNLSLDSLFIPARRHQQPKLKSAANASGNTTGLLEIAQLHVRIPERTLLKNVSLNLRAGEIVALTGLSGSGKSTLLRAALGRLPDTLKSQRGDVWLSGQPLFSLSDVALRKLRAQQIGFVPQDPRQSLVASQTVATYFTLMAARRGLSAKQRDEQIAAHFRELGLPDDKAFLQRFPHQLSGGQRQRVMVVAAMLGYPPLMVMDEPTSALDGLTTQMLMNWVVEKARAHHQCVWFVAHDLPQATKIADRIQVMAQGELVEQQATTDFLRAPQSNDGKRLMAAWQPGVISYQKGSRQPPLLKASAICAHYTGRQVLDGVHITLRAGETLTVAGRSGCGKTTLLRTIMGLHSRVSGEITFRSEALPLSLDQRTALQKNRLQYVAQNPASSLNPFYPVRSLLGRALHLSAPRLDKNERETRIRDALHQVGLPPSLLGQRPTTLSGGQLQRIALACALIARPKVLLCDEVTSAIDGPTRLELIALLQQIQQQQGIALLMVTHDLTLPAQTGGKLLVLENGCIAEYGNVAALLSRPAHPLTQQLRDATKLITGGEK